MSTKWPKRQVTKISAVLDYGAIMKNTERNELFSRRQEICQSVKIVLLCVKWNKELNWIELSQIYIHILINK